MVRALRIVSLERGHDPREMALVAFGGAGPMHAAALADELGIPEVVVPPVPGLFSAVGLLVADFRCDRVESVMRPLAGLDSAWLETRFRRLEAEAEEAVRDGDGRRRVVAQRTLDLRYVGQSYELSVPATADLRATADAFRARHADIYGYAPAHEPVEVVNARVTAFGETPPVGLWDHSATRAADPASGGRARGGRRRRAYVGGRWEDVPVLAREALGPGDPVRGPAIVEEDTATTIVPSGWTVAAGEAGTLRLRRTGR